MLVLVVGASLASVHQELGDGVDANPGDARHGSQTHALAEKGEDLNALVAGELVHGRHDSELYARQSSILFRHTPPHVAVIIAETEA